MINALLACYNKNISDTLREKFTADFKSADRTLLVAIWTFSIIVAFVTSWQHGYFVLGITSGLVISVVATLAYKFVPGTFISRVIMATALSGMVAVMVQQSNGLGEGHFIFFLSFTILIRYRDIVPVAVLVGLTVVHHLTLTYCQMLGIELWGQEILVFSWGDQTPWGLLAPLIYHVIFTLLSLSVSTFYIYENNKMFVESNQVIGAVEQAASGDLSVRINELIGQSDLVKEVNHFLQRLDETFNEVNKVVKTLTEQASSINESARTRSKQAEKQQQGVSSVVTAITEMATATQEIRDNASQTAALANDTVTVSDTGGAIANACRKSIVELAEQVEQAAKTIAELDENSQQISGIVQTISGIAEQTNLLALNAAIEAARAGEQGRGFAVVADEVRVLSQRTHSSTEEITNMITTFQSSTRSAVNNMSSCHELADSSVTEAVKAAESFADIAVAIKDISDRSTNIAAEAAQQANVTSTINSDTQTINEVSEASLEDAQTGKQEAKALTVQADKMQRSLDHFQLD